MSDSKETGYINKPKLSEAEVQQKVEGIRNDIAKKMTKWADRIQVSMAFTPKIKRVEGERWTENDKRYEMRDGIKQSISLMQEVRMPWWCPKCSKPMNHRFDRKFYYLRGWCFNCNVDIEGQMRFDGTYEAYEKRLLRENEKSYLRDKIQERMDYIRTFKIPQVHFQDGRWEELATMDMFADLFQELEKEIDWCQARLEFLMQQDQEEESNANTPAEP
jgi:hypothetical protein